MLTDLKIGSFYKVENKMTGRAVSGQDNRVFEKKDYAFSIKDITEGSVIVSYMGDEYAFEKDYAQHNMRPALTYEDIKDFIVLKYITGSRAYGTNVPTSDTDYKAVFIFPDSWYARLDFNPDWDEIHTKDHSTNEETTYYSLRKFMSLLLVNNPNILEVFDIPDDCLIYKHPCMDHILSNQQSFVSKLCYKAFLGYGESQIRKADGQDKMSNWEKQDMVRKTPLDFCYTFKGQGSIPIAEWLEENGLDQRFCALNDISHMHNMYGVYYDHFAHTVVYIKEMISGIRNVSDIFSSICINVIYNTISIETVSKLNLNKSDNTLIKDQLEALLEALMKSDKMMLGYKGIVLDDSNTIRLSATPKDAEPLVYMSYNKDAYTTHCKLYNRYLTWKKERNDARWTDVEGHNQKIDGKNMLHCMRLIYMCQDIGEGRGIVVRRPEAEYLKSIRYGKVNLDTLMSEAATKLVELEDVFVKSDLISEPVESEVNLLYKETLKDYKAERLNPFGYRVYRDKK